MSYWIFVIKNTRDVFNDRVRSKRWLIFNRTANKRDLKIGDAVVFYQAGKGGQKFLGAAIIASKLKTEQGKIDSYLNLKDTEVWKKPVSIRQIINDLKFIANAQNWGLYLQGGVIRIKVKDFQTIISKSKTSGKTSEVRH